MIRIIAESNPNLSPPLALEIDEEGPEGEFVRAMQEYKRSSGRMFPTWSEVLEVICLLGYEKTVAQHTPHKARSRTESR